MAQRDIQVDLGELAELSANLKVAHDTLNRSPRYKKLHAGDRRERVPGAVSDFIEKNVSPREQLVQKLDVAHQSIEAVVLHFGETESCLVRALSGESK